MNIKSMVITAAGTMAVMAILFRVSPEIRKQVLGV